VLSRRNNLINNTFAAIAEALGGLEDGIILDGEIVALDEEGRPSFNLMQHRSSSKRPVFFYAFDLLAYRKRDLRALALTQRRQLLDEVLVNAHDPVRVSAILRANARDLVRAVQEQGLEGLIAKRSSSKYETGERSGTWLKYKINRGQELVIGGFKPGGKNFFENLAVGYYDQDRLIFIPKIKNGFTPSNQTGAV
jgi:bifunctional non-homologous end joining protein LigD